MTGLLLILVALIVRGLAFEYQTYNFGSITDELVNVWVSGMKMKNGLWSVVSGRRVMTDLKSFNVQ